jgi:phage major head subunit gpT-like protein
LGQQILEAGGHFQGSLAAKGHRHDLVGFDELFLNKMSETESQYSGLASACTSNNQKRTFAVFNGQTLSFIQF